MYKKIFFFLAVFAVSACEDKLDDQQKLNEYVNEWIYSNMDAYYYWTTELPAFKKTTETPSAYFSTLINSEDRFSAFFEDYEKLMNQLNGISPSEVGFEFKLYLESMGSSKVLAVVTYTKPNTSARLSGMKRGDIINRINETEITLDNYQTLLASLSNASTSVKLGFATYTDGKYVNSNERTLTKILNYIEHPIFLDTIYTFDNAKVGYLVYNFFTNDPDDGSMRYDLALNDVMAKFNSEKITELVVDLRYNSGGMMSSAVHLGSMLVPEPSSSKVFSYTEYNKNLTDYFNSSEYKKKYSSNPFVDNFETEIVVDKQKHLLNNVSSNLKRIFFLTGSSTASASEMVINGLKPYISCVMIGETTRGKNVGSIVINDDDNLKNKNAIMPIILKYFNKDRKSDFTLGFIPDIVKADDTTHELGDIKEGLLTVALGEITGNDFSKVKGQEIKVLAPRFAIPYEKQALMIYDQFSGISFQ